MLFISFEWMTLLFFVTFSNDLAPY